MKAKTTEDPTAKARRVWEQLAPRYDRDIRFWEKVQFGGGREWVCSRATGRTLEVAVGTGRNLPFYPPGVSLTGVDLSPAMLAIAGRRASELGVAVELREADAQTLPFEPASFDSVVCTLSLCTIPDHRRAIAEMARVLRPPADRPWRSDGMSSSRARCGGPGCRPTLGYCCYGTAAQDHHDHPHPADLVPEGRHS